MSELFSSFTLRGITFKNRIFVSPMCQYSSIDGLANDWHLVHLGSRAIGGAALVMTEATAVTAQGRISPQDLGIWSDAHVAAVAPVVRFVREHGAVPAMQLAHAGRKASTAAPWDGGKFIPQERGGWDIVAPSPIAFSDAVPHELTIAQIRDIATAFAQAAERALAAGFDVIEIHAAHGYLLHEFLSPISNQRTDEYGGSFENRVRAPLEVVSAVRKVWPESKPLFVRISATDWIDGGWDLEGSVRFAKGLKDVGVDLVDCSSGGLAPAQKVVLGPGYQVRFAEAVRREAGIATGAVGLITEPRQAEDIVSNRQADVVLLAREMLRNPYWPMRAAMALGAHPELPKQYERALPPKR
jgi:2,4-dienoyl-CoA reductase-like NADH-dependent reductase (Old Yellow Enzyme family)